MVKHWITSVPSGATRTVKPVLGGHLWEGPKVVSQGKWSLRPGNQDN